jgi:uncharacterized protein YidB (DUF937 family)
MGPFDNAVPGGSVARPLMVALGALLSEKSRVGRANRILHPRSRPLAAPQTAGGSGALIPDGLAGGLRSLLERLTSAGHRDMANSWVASVPTNRSSLGTLAPYSAR